MPREFSFGGSVDGRNVWHEIDDSRRGGKMVVADQTAKRRADRDHKQGHGDVDELWAPAQHG